VAILSLAWKSLRNRRFTAALTVASIALSVALLVGVERIRHQAKASFTNTISGTDLIVGARSGPIQLLLYSVFHLGSATNNISWESWREIAGHPKVAWAVPLSLGDSHRGYPVLGTTLDYFTRFRYARDRGLELAQGQVFGDLFDAVLGAEVAQALGYRLGDPIVLAHGAGDVSFARHEDKPFRVVGILARTGTPVDRTVLVGLEAIEAIHANWQGGAPVSGRGLSPEQARALDLTPRAITAGLLGLKSRIATFQVQRFVNDYAQEPLLAILPAVALGEFWKLIGVAEAALLMVSGCVVVVGLAGMLAALLSGLNERRREMAILRSVGARPLHVFALIMGEAFVLTLIGVALGLALLYLLLAVVQPLVESRFGLFLALGSPSTSELRLLAAVALGGAVIGSIPAYRAYRLSLADGLSIRI
jgi:putative ABC transport system permease protein